MLIKEGTKPGQSVITDYFDVQKICDFIESNNEIRTQINKNCGKSLESNISPLLQRLYNNAKTNISARKQGNRHDLVVKQFGIAMLILAGKSTYEFIQANFGKRERILFDFMYLESKKITRTFFSIFAFKCKS